MKFDIKLDWASMNANAVATAIVDNASRTSDDGEALIIQVPAIEIWPHSAHNIKDGAMVAVWMLPTTGPILIRVSAVPVDVSRRSKIVVVDAADFFNIHEASEVLALDDIGVDGDPDYRLTRIPDADWLMDWAIGEAEAPVDPDEAELQSLLYDWLPMEIH